MKAAHKMHCVAAVLFLVMTPGFTAAADKADLPVVRQKTPDGVEFGTWGNPPTRPAPTIFMLASTISDTLGDPYFRQCGNELAALGYLVVSIDLPCHGSQSIDGEPAGISGWAHRTGKNEDFVAECNARLSNVLDHLIKTGVTDPDRVAAGGTSRGGFLAIHFAAYDRRVKAAVAFAPVTELSALREFQGQQHPLVARLSLISQAQQLAGRPVWIIIGDVDERVGTEHAIALSRRLSSLAKQRKVASNAELHVMSEPRGHTTPKGASKLAAAWVHSHLQPTPAP